MNRYDNRQNIRSDITKEFIIIIIIMQPVHQFALEGKYIELKDLLQKNLSIVHTDDAHGLKPLHHAVHAGSIECIQLLIANGADVNAKNEQNISIERRSL